LASWPIAGSQSQHPVISENPRLPLIA